MIQSTRRLWLAGLGAAALPAASPAAERLRQRFLAPCCWRESLAVHSSPKADELRAEIDRRLAEGQSEEQITDHFLAAYGERILREPRGAKGVWLTALPVAATGAALAGLGGLLYFWQKRARAAASRTTWEGPLPDLPSEFHGDTH